MKYSAGKHEVYSGARGGEVTPTLNREQNSPSLSPTIISDTAYTLYTNLYIILSPHLTLNFTPIHHLND